MEAKTNEEQQNKTHFNARTYVWIENEYCEAKPGTIQSIIDCIQYIRRQVHAADCFKPE